MCGETHRWRELRKIKNEKIEGGRRVTENESEVDRGRLKTYLLQLQLRRENITTEYALYLVSSVDKIKKRFIKKQFIQIFFL